MLVVCVFIGTIIMVRGIITIALGLIRLFQRIKVVKKVLVELDKGRYQQTELPKFMSMNQLNSGSMTMIPEGTNM